MVKEVSIAIRDLVIQEWKGNVNETLSQRQIGEKFKIPKSTLNNIIQKYKNTGAIVNLQGRGRKPIFTQRDVRTLVRKEKVTPELSAPKLIVK